MSKPTKFDPRHPPGRIAFDDSGYARWEWRTETGSFKPDIDTQKMRVLQQPTDAQPDVTQASPPSGDPYRTADAPRVPEKTPRRTLDDMRKLSEEIKRARALKKSP
jgi:hypothetical protein